MGEQILVAAEVEVSEDKLKAFIYMRSEAFGQALNIEYLSTVLERARVVNGIDTAVLNSLVEKPVFNVPTLVAAGTRAVNGKDGKIVFHFNKERDISPKQKQDGSVDFKDLGIIQTVTKGALLAEKIPPTSGTPGIDVFGQPVKPTPGKDISIPAGRSVELSPDKLKLFAGVDGQVEYLNDRVSVFNTYTVDGDVGTTTGNIDFNGNVLVKGNVQPGFNITAIGNIEINGSVEMSLITAGGNIIIRGGFNGGGKGELKAGGNITSRFIQSGKASAAKKVETTYIYNSTVRSGDTINVIGKGVVIGGHLMARTRIDGATFGNENLTATLVEVGSDPDTLARYREIPEELTNCRNNIKAIQGALDMLEQLRAAGKLAPEKEAQIPKSQAMITQLIETEERLVAEQESVNAVVASLGKGFVHVRNVAYPGVKIMMGSEVFPIKAKYVRTTFSRPEGYIKSGPL